MNNKNRNKNHPKSVNTNSSYSVDKVISLSKSKNNNSFDIVNSDSLDSNIQSYISPSKFNALLDEPTTDNIKIINDNYYRLKWEINSENYDRFQALNNSISVFKDDLRQHIDDKISNNDKKFDTIKDKISELKEELKEYVNKEIKEHIGTKKETKRWNVSTILAIAAIIISVLIGVFGTDIRNIFKIITITRK